MAILTGINSCRKEIRQTYDGGKRSLPCLGTFGNVWAQKGTKRNVWARLGTLTLSGATRLFLFYLYLSYACLIEVLCKSYTRLTGVNNH